MSQKHAVQHGTFLITTNARNYIPWCIVSGIPTIIIDNIVMTKNLQKAQLHAFCILPDHVHVIVSPGTLGLSAFMHSFKRNAMRDIRRMFSKNDTCNHLVVVENRIFRAEVTNLRYGEWLDPPMIAWQKSFHDERIRDSRQLSAALGYVQGNAMKHNHVYEQADWPWTSIHFPHLLDPVEM